MSDSVVEEYNVRRDISTKVLVAKMRKDMSSRMNSVINAAMPTMEHHGVMEYVVCPVLILLSGELRSKAVAQQEREERHACIEHAARTDTETSDDFSIGDVALQVLLALMNSNNANDSIAGFNSGGM